MHEPQAGNAQVNYRGFQESDFQGVVVQCFYANALPISFAGVEGFCALDEPVDQESIIRSSSGISGPFNTICEILRGDHVGVAFAVQYLDNLVIYFVVFDPGYVVTEIEGEREPVF